MPLFLGVQKYCLHFWKSHKKLLVWNCLSFLDISTITMCKEVHLLLRANFWPPKRERGLRRHLSKKALNQTSWIFLNFQNHKEFWKADDQKYAFGGGASSVNLLNQDFLYIYIFRMEMEVVFKVLMEKKRGTQVAPELINTNLAFTSHAGGEGAGAQVCH